MILCLLFVFVIHALTCGADAWKLSDFSHYADYLPYRVEGFAGLEDFRTAANPPSHLRNRKMFTGGLKLDVSDVLTDVMWPSRWPFAPDDFRPLDSQRDQVISTLHQYDYSQRLVEADFIALVPGLVRLPVNRHFVQPKDRVAFTEHIRDYSVSGATVLEIFSCHESLLPKVSKPGPVVGIGWSHEEMLCNPTLDDWITQDVTVDPYLPLASNYFDLVIVPAMFQLFQRPLEMFQEINRVLKPGGVAVVGVKLSMWSFLNWKQGRYFVETSYLEDVLALGAFFHYAQGYSAPLAFDLTLPETNIVGKTKDLLFPNPRADFYACVEARKLHTSPHGVADSHGEREDNGENPEKGLRYKPKMMREDPTDVDRQSPYY